MQTFTSYIFVQYVMFSQRKGDCLITEFGKDLRGRMHRNLLFLAHLIKLNLTKYYELSIGVVIDVVVGIVTIGICKQSS